MPESFEAGVRFVATDEGVSATTAKMGTHFERTTEKMRQVIKQTGYLELALKRIAIYTAIFTFFGALTKLIGEAISLETRLAEVSTLVNMRNKEMAESFRVVTGDLMQLSPYLGAATDLTKGLYEIMSAGVTKPAEAFKLLVVSAKYAKAGITDLATAASSLTAIMKAYGYTADEMRGKSDMLFASVMEGKYHADELNQAIGKVLPTSAAMGVHIDEVSAALAVMTQRGLDVNEAATALNRMMLAFMRPIDKAKKEFQKLGWAWGRNAFEGIGLEGVLRRLVRASTRYGDILPKIFRRQRALRGAFILAGKGFKDYVRLLQKIRDATDDGGEVARGYGKMIQTVGEEVKAAGAKMLKVMYELWKGKGFEWLGGFIRLLSSSIAVVLKSSRVTLAAVPIIYGLAKAIKAANATLLMWRTNMAAHYATTGQMTKALYAQGVALQVVTKRARALAGALMAVKVGVIAGVIAYIAIKAGLDAWIASSDRGIAKIHQETKAMKALRDEFNMYAIAAKQAGETTRDVVAELRALAKADVLEALRLTFRSRRKDLELFRRIMKALGDEFGENAVKAGQMWVDVKRLMKITKEGGKVGEEFNYILEALARSWGYTTKKLREYIEAGKLNIAVMEAHIEGLRFLSRLQRDWNKIVESSSQHVRGLARILSKTELEDSIKLLGELMTLEKGTAKWERAEEYFQSLGLSLEKLTEKTLPEFKKRFEEALAVQPGVFREMKYEEFMREYLVIFEKMHPPLQDLEESVRALADTWKTEWVEAYGDSAEVLKLFVDKHRTQLELIKNNLERLGDVQGKIVVEEMIKHLSKGLTAQQKAAKKALSLHEALANDFIRIDTTMEQLKNELRGEEYNNVIEQTKKLITLEMKKLAKWVGLEIKAGSDMIAVWEEYTEKKLKLDKLLALSEAVGRRRKFEAQVTENERLLQMDYEFTWQRIAAAKEMYSTMEAQIRGLTDISEEEMKGLLSVLAGFLAYIKKLEGLETKWTPWVEALGYAQKLLRAIVAQLKDFADVMGITSGGLLRVINTLDVLYKGLGAIKAGMQMVEYAASEAIVGIAATFMKLMGWIAIILAAITMVISLFKVLFGREQQTEAERMAEQVRKVQKELKFLGDVSDSVAEEFINLTGEVGRTWALLKILPDIMREGGVTTKSFAAALKVLLDVLEKIRDSGVIPELEEGVRRVRREVDRGRRRTREYRDEWRDTYEDITDTYSPEDIELLIVDLGLAFQELIEHAKRLGIEGSAALVQFIQEIREMGLSVQEVDEYVFGWLTRASEGLTAMIAASSGTREELVRLGDLTLAVFAGLVAQGMSWIDALSLMEEPLHELRRKYRALGDESNVAVDQLLKIAFVAEKYQDLFAAISGTDEVLAALGNTGFLTQESLTAVAEQAQSYYERLTAAGLTSREALAVMAPILQNLQWYADQYGFSLDDNTQSLIDQAEELGLLEKVGQDVNTILLAGFDDMITAINALTDVFRDFIDGLADAGTGTDSLVDTTINLRDTWRDVFEQVDRVRKGVRDMDFGAANIMSAQAGIKDIGQTQLVRVHRGESIIPEDLANALRQFYGGAPVSGVGGEGEGGGGRMVAIIEIDGRQFYKALVPYIREGGEVGDFEVDGAAVQ